MKNETQKWYGQRGYLEAPDSGSDSSPGHGKRKTRVIHSGEPHMISKRLLALWLCPLLVGCVESIHPLTPLDEAVLEKQFFGSWIADAGSEDENDATVIAHIGSAGILTPRDGYSNFPDEERLDSTPLEIKNLTHITWVEMKPNGEVETSLWLAYPTRIGDTIYANVPIFEQRKIKRFFFWKTRFEGDDLLAWTSLDDTGIDELVRKGVLHKSENTITDSAEILGQVIQQYDSVLFPPRKAGRFRRIPTPVHTKSGEITSQYKIVFPSRDGYLIQINLDIGWEDTAARDETEMRLIAEIERQIRNLGSQLDLLAMAGREQHRDFMTRLNGEVISNSAKNSKVQITKCQLKMLVKSLNESMRTELKSLVAKEVLLRE